MDYQGGGGGGGGFSSQQQSQQSSSGGRARRSYDEQTAIPVTIRMILAAQPTAEGQPGICLEDGRKVSHVKLVAAVRSVDDFSTNVVFKVEDGTGLIDVKQWLDDNQCSALVEIREQTKQENVYLKIVGQVKEYDNMKQIVADSVRPLSTGNELSHHFLDVVYSGEKYKNAGRYVAVPQPMGAMGGVGFGPTGGNTGQAFGATAFAGGGGGGSADGLRDAVLNFIRQQGSTADSGAYIQDCIRQLATGGTSEGSVRKMIEDLASEGHIYSTINEDYYQYAG